MDGVEVGVACSTSQEDTIDEQFAYLLLGPPGRGTVGPVPLGQKGSSQPLDARGIGFEHSLTRDVELILVIGTRVAVQRETSVAVEVVALWRRNQEHVKAAVNDERTDGV